MPPYRTITSNEEPEFYSSSALADGRGGRIWSHHGLCR